MIEIVHTKEELAEVLHNDIMCKGIGGAIMKEYPDRKWYVEVLDKCRVCYIKIPDISMEYGVSILLTGSVVPDTRRCVRAAGELLERFTLTRGRTDNADLIALERGYKGVVGAKAGEM